MLQVVTVSIVLILAHPWAVIYRCHDEQSKKDQPVVQTPVSNSNELRVLAEGHQSSVSEPFVAVIRDAETYARLRKAEPQLPAVQPDFFSLNVIIAAFLGRRTTGGYQVEITRDGPNMRVSEKAPAKGAMTIQILTAPFKVVSFQPNGSTEIELGVDRTFRTGLDRYTVSAGQFTLSGGFTGRSESIQLHGQLEVSRWRDLITIRFDLTSDGGSRPRGLKGYATGFIEHDEIRIDKQSHGSLLDPPSGELTVTGKFVAKDRLSLSLSSKAINVPESYGGTGSLEADSMSGPRP